MKFTKRFFRPNVLAVAAVALSLSSCNRGYGCPTNFSMSEVVDGLGAALSLLF